MLVAAPPAPTACNTPLRCNVTAKPASAINAIRAVSRPLPRDGCAKGGATTTGGVNGKTGAPALSGGGTLGARLGLGGGGGGGALPSGGGADRIEGGGGVGRCEGGGGATEGGVGRAEGGGGAERTGADAGAAVQPGINVAR